MSNPNPTCPFEAKIIRFNAYVVSADFEYRPDSGAPAKQHLIHSRYESPNPFSARARAIREIRRIKGLLDQGLHSADVKYNYEGISLWLEYEISQPCGEILPEIKKLYLLDGEIDTRDNLLQRLSNEEFLLDAAGFSFVRGIVDGDDGQDYATMVDDLFDGLVEIQPSNFLNKLSF